MISESEKSRTTYIRDNPLLDAFKMQQLSELRVPNAERAAFYLDAAVAARGREGINAHMFYTLHVYKYNITEKGGGIIKITDIYEI
jgi:kinesin family protein 26